jgi:CubicO group peptidase (beta-lactamase class C family)
MKIGSLDFGRYFRIKAGMHPMNYLTRRQFIKLGIASGTLALGLPAAYGLGTDNLSLGKEQDMSRTGDQNKKLEGKINPTKVNELTQLFDKMIKDGLHPGAQLCVYYQGEPVIELAGGLEAPAGRPVTNQTLYQIRSTTKALAAIAMLILYEKRLFSFEDPVAKHWPKFGSRGKQSITIAQIMSHSAGIPDGPMIPPDKMGDRSAVAAAVEALEPIWTPGTANGYHAATFGWVLDELVYRWEGRNISRFMAEEVIQPLGLKNIFIGLPPREFPRMAKMFVEGGVRERQDTRARFSDFLNTLEGMGLPLAWVGGVATARDLAHLMNILAYEGTYASRIFFTKQTQEKATRPLNPPDAVDRRLTLPIRWGLGFMLGTTPRLYGDRLNPRVVGHAGGSACIAWADPDLKLSVAFLTNKMVGMNIAFDRYKDIANKVYECLNIWMN